MTQLRKYEREAAWQLFTHLLVYLQPILPPSREEAAMTTRTDVTRTGPSSMIPELHNREGKYLDTATAGVRLPITASLIGPSDVGPGTACLTARIDNATRFQELLVIVMHVCGGQPGGGSEILSLR
ncbi:uncharacterized protein N7506_012189 [Penicillium brevicompactum]|uniref:uncharacterized protein n=1 Tax=Penicillium brevicompactum TaxID=5074 RepID=UPI00253FEA31|nr:uncharacterized protein N7506_012189 [Penicillium brevicompactum]KAJ5319485.1 hypothetical protein N7506_012189 [Penicillium brevicompactum]